VLIVGRDFGTADLPCSNVSPAARFRDLIVRRGLFFTNCDGALRAIALGVCDYLAESTGCPGQSVKMPLEGSIIPVIEGMFKEGAANH
jgi:hypothetical protein